MIQNEAVENSMAKLRKKLEERGMVFQFLVGAPLQLIVKRDDTQKSMLDDDDMVIVLTMETWGDIRYMFQGCDNYSIPEDLLRIIKAGFKKIAGDYLMLRHYLDIATEEGRRQE